MVGVLEDEEVDDEVDAVEVESGVVEVEELVGKKYSEVVNVGEDVDLDIGVSTLEMTTVLDSVDVGDLDV